MLIGRAAASLGRAAAFSPAGLPQLARTCACTNTRGISTFSVWGALRPMSGRKVPLAAPNQVPKAGMKVAVYGYEKYDQKFFGKGLKELVGEDNVKLLPVNLLHATTDLAKDCDAVCIFVNDCADATVIASLAKLGVKLLLLRSAGSISHEHLLH